jgi:hypothetical protein
VDELPADHARFLHRPHAVADDEAVLEAEHAADVQRRVPPHRVAADGDDFGLRRVDAQRVDGRARIDERAGVLADHVLRAERRRRVEIPQRRVAAGRAHAVGVGEPAVDSRSQVLAQRLREEPQFGFGVGAATRAHEDDAFRHGTALRLARP